MRGDRYDRRPERRISPAFLPLVHEEHDASKRRTPLVSLGHGLGVALLELRGETQQLLFREDLHDEGIDPVEAYQAARARLLRVVYARLIPMVVSAGPWGTRCLSFHHPFLAASCLVLPGLYERCARELGRESMVAVTARRDLLLVAPDLGTPFRAALLDVLRPPGAPAGGSTLFTLEPAGPQSVTRPLGELSSGAHAA